MKEAHGRFQSWLTAGADGDPPRDLGVHASVCAACRQSMAALDLLTIVDPGLAGMPSPRPVAARSGVAHAGRMATTAAGVMFSAVIVGIGATQLVALSRTGSGGPVAQASQTPDRGVLGGRQTAAPTSSSQPSSGESLTPVPTPEPTTQPAGSSETPNATPRATPRRTPRPSPAPTSSPTPAPSVQPSATPTPLTTATPTPVPTETATPTPPGPTVPGAPESLTAQPGSNSGEIVLSWQAPLSDGGDPVVGYKICQADQQGGPYTCTSTGSTATSAIVSGLTPTTQYWYRAVAVNSVGDSQMSNEDTAVATP